MARPSAPRMPDCAPPPRSSSSIDSCSVRSCAEPSRTGRSPPSARRSSIPTSPSIRRLADQMEARATRGEESRLAARRLALAALEVEAEARGAQRRRPVRARSAFALHGETLRWSRPERPPLPAVPDSLRNPRHGPTWWRDATKSSKQSGSSGAGGAFSSSPSSPSAGSRSATTPSATKGHVSA